MSSKTFLLLYNIPFSFPFSNVARFLVHRLLILYRFLAHFLVHSLLVQCSSHCSKKQQLWAASHFHHLRRWRRRSSTSIRNFKRNCHGTWYHSRNHNAQKNQSGTYLFRWVYECSNDLWETFLWYRLSRFWQKFGLQNCGRWSNLVTNQAAAQRLRNPAGMFVFEVTEGNFCMQNWNVFLNHVWLRTDSTKINRPEHNIRMYWTNFRQPTAHVQQTIFWKILIEVCSLHLYASFGTFCVQIGQSFVSQWVFKQSEEFRNRRHFPSKTAIVDFQTYFKDSLCLE